MVYERRASPQGRTPENDNGWDKSLVFDYPPAPYADHD